MFLSFIGAFLLGTSFASAATVSKDINSNLGAQIANKDVHKFMTKLGNLSNLILPCIAILIAFLAKGIAGGVVVLLGLILGAVVLGILRLPYSLRLMLATIGLPICVLVFIAFLFF